MSVNRMIDKTGSRNMLACGLMQLISSMLRITAQSILLLCLLPALQAQAQVTSAIYVPSTTPPPAPIPNFASFRDSVIDLSVKVWGGNIVIQRGYQDGRWYSNLDWMPLSVTYDSLDSSVKTITRGHTEYSKVAPGVYQDQNHNTLRITDSGFRWNNPQADWIEYNPAGEIKALGNRNGTVATFQYSDPAGVLDSSGLPAREGRITGILDHSSNQVLWFDYDANKQLIRITDIAARKVEYQWVINLGIQNIFSISGSGNSIALTVTDVNGGTWSYWATGIYPPEPVGMASTGGGGGGGSAIAPPPPPPPDTACQRAAGVNLGITDPQGHSTYRSWYPNGALALTTYADGTGLCTNQDYDAAKKIFYTREIAAGGKLTETWSELKQDMNRGYFLRRDINGVTIAQQSLDTANRITTVTDARGLNTAITRDQWDNVTRIVYPDGSVESTQYDSNYSNVTQHSDENGVVTQYTYDAHGNLTKMVEALGLAEQRTTNYINDADGQLKSMTRKGDANTPDATTLFDYDTNGNVIKVTDAEGGITQFTEYDVMGNALTRIDPRGKVWKQSFDNFGRLLSSTDPLNRTTTITYDKAGLPATIIDPVGNISTLGLDAAGKILNVTDANGAKTSLTYDAANNPSTITDSEAHTQKLDYDLDGRPVKHTDGNGNVTQLVYGDQASGLNRLLTKVIYPTLKQEYNYDQRDRITQGTDTAAGTALALDGSASQSTKIQYDSTGKPTVITDPASRNSGTSYNGLGQVTQDTDPTGGITQYGYDARGNLTSVKDAKGNTHRFEYDKLDRMVKEIRPLGQTIAYSYDANSNLRQVTDPKGQVKKYTYDDVNRRTQEDHYLTATDTTPVKSISYSYNTLDRLIGYNDGTTIGTFSYDAKQLKQTGQSVNYGSFTLATSFTLNSLGQKTDITYPDGAHYNFTYDNNNQLSTVNFPTGFGSITINSYNWLVPSQITLPGGTVRNQNYDGLLRLKDFSVKDPGQSQVLNYQYGYDLTDNIISKVTEAGTTNYGYDTLDHLTSASYTGTGQSNETYTYDGVDNRVTDSKTAAAIWVYDANNQLTTASNLSYTYDDNGNTTNQTDSANAANTRNYVYDTDNRLVEVRNASNTLIAAYSYDPFGRRLSKDAGSSKTYYFYNEEGLIAEADATGMLTKSYGYAPGSTFSTNPLWQKSGNAYYTYQNDHLGTPMKLLSQSGAVVWSATYDAFGKATVAAGSSISNNLRFPGQYYDQETGLHYNWQRYYDPTQGRYITADPIGLMGGINVYTYVGGNPLADMDPYGLFGMADMPTFPQGVVDFSAGFGDTLSFGITNGLRSLMGVNGSVNKCSGSYRGGELSGVGLSLAFGGAHLGRNLLNQMGRRGNLTTRFQRGFDRLWKDSRGWDAVRDTWSLAAGNGKRWLLDNGTQLHHWFKTQSAGKLIPGFKDKLNAGWNYLPTSNWVNNLMGNGTGSFLAWGSFNLFRGSVVGIYGAIPTAAVSESYTALSGDCVCQSK